MDKLIKPYDLGENNLVEETETIKIQDIIRLAQKELKPAIIRAHTEALGGVNIEFSTTKTRFGGERLWFVCPACQRRVGCLYRGSGAVQLGCRECLGLKYRKQRYKSN